MPEIRIQREHRLGLARARKVARQWAEEVERRFEMRCVASEGRTEDTVVFTRPGVEGTLRVTADRFELEAALGFLVGIFSRRIEAEIEAQLDELLAASASTEAPGRKAPAARAPSAKAAPPREPAARKSARASAAPARAGTHARTKARPKRSAARRSSRTRKGSSGATRRAA